MHATRYMTGVVWGEELVEVTVKAGVAICNQRRIRSMFLAVLMMLLGYKQISQMRHPRSIPLGA